MARYLDLLPRDARARVGAASRWSSTDHVDQSGARSLLGHAEDWSWPNVESIPQCGAPAVFRLRALAGDQLWTSQPLIAARFRRLVERRGLDAAVALIRARIERAASAQPIAIRRGVLRVLP
jgi:hypothetical protein